MNDETMKARIMVLEDDLREARTRYDALSAIHAECPTFATLAPAFTAAIAAGIPAPAQQGESREASAMREERHARELRHEQDRWMRAEEQNTRLHWLCNEAARILSVPYPHAAGGAREVEAALGPACTCGSYAPGCPHAQSCPRAGWSPASDKHTNPSTKGGTP
jgi:hypothetical protein